MAYIKIFPIKVTVKKALDYIMNPDKTEEKLLISSFACSPESADLEFAFTREEGKKNVMDKGNNLAFHLIQSFKPGEVDAETAHKLGKEFADKVLLLDILLMCILFQQYCSLFRLIFQLVLLFPK